MKLTDMNPKLGLLATIVTGAILMTAFYSIAMANPAEHRDHKQMNPEQMQQYRQEHMKIGLDRLAQRLEIKASQQAVWEDFTKSVETLADQNGKKPGDDADAATIARYRADKAAEFASKLNKIADATSKLQAVLSEDQRKIFNQTAHRFLRHGQDAARFHHGMDRDGKDHRWDQHKQGALQGS